MRRAARLRVALATAALVASPLAGCGYSAGPLVAAERRRVHVPLFENRTWYRDLEVELTRQVEKELASRPGISISPREGADIVLAGSIVDFAQRVLSEDSEDRVRESSAITRVQVDVVDARSGALLKRYSIRDRAEFHAGRGESLGSATSESFFDVARRIVDGLEDDFPRASPAARGEAPAPSGREGSERSDG